MTSTKDGREIPPVEVHNTELDGWPQHKEGSYIPPSIFLYMAFPLQVLPPLDGCVPGSIVRGVSP